MTTVGQRAKNLSKQVESVTRNGKDETEETCLHVFAVRATIIGRGSSLMQIRRLHQNQLEPDFGTSVEPSLR
jgi:hypothetical protein